MSDLIARRFFAGKFFLAIAAVNIVTTMPSNGAAALLRLTGYRYGFRLA